MQLAGNFLILILFPLKNLKPTKNIEQDLQKQNFGQELFSFN